MRLVLIEWLDSHGGTSGWTPVENMTPDLLTVRSTGWLVHDTNAVKVIVPHLVEPDPTTRIATQGRGDMTIPCAAIISIRDIAVPSDAA